MTSRRRTADEQEGGDSGDVNTFPSLDPTEQRGQREARAAAEKSVSLTPKRRVNPPRSHAPAARRSASPPLARHLRQSSAVGRRTANYPQMSSGKQTKHSVACGSGDTCLAGGTGTFQEAYLILMSQSGHMMALNGPGGRLIVGLAVRYGFK